MQVLRPPPFAFPFWALESLASPRALTPRIAVAFYYPKDQESGSVRQLIQEVEKYAPYFSPTTYNKPPANRASDTRRFMAVAGRRKKSWGRFRSPFLLSLLCALYDFISWNTVVVCCKQEKILGILSWILPVWGIISLRLVVWLV